jgi:hypothetical protein
MFGGRRSFVGGRAAQNDARVSASLDLGAAQSGFDRIGFLLYKRAEIFFAKKGSLNSGLI